MPAYAGTIDRVATINGKTWVLDLKTGRKSPKTHALQGAAYAIAYEQRHEVLVDGFCCVYLHPARPTRGKAYSLSTWVGDKSTDWRNRWTDLVQDIEGEEVQAGASLTFDAEAHVYRLGEVELPSVTTLIQDLVTKKPYTGDPAYGIRGTRIHQATEWMDQGELDGETRRHPDYIEWLDAWDHFKKDHQPTFSGIEERVWAAI
ncbi:MAG: PD-(D/E)XK nuclease family protein [Myxococcota bacterium]